MKEWLYGRSQEMISGLIEDISLYGFDKEILLIFDAKTHAPEDYELDIEDAQLYADEEYTVSTLWQALILWIMDSKMKVTHEELPAKCAAMIAFRLLSGDTQATFAANIGRIERSVQRWEAGDRVPSLDDVLEMYERFNVPLSLSKIFKVSVNG